MSSLKKIGLIATFVISFGFISSAYAQPKPWIWGWWPSHWIHQDFIPYLEEGKHPHNSQWDNHPWEPEHWAQQRQNGEQVIEGFYRADIIRRQYIRKGVPVLVVGPAFYLLGGHDKRRVAEMVDNVYNITTTRENGMYMLHDWRSRRPIGSYTRYGLQLQ